MHADRIALLLNAGLAMSASIVLYAQMTRDQLLRGLMRLPSASEDTRISCCGASPADEVPACLSALSISDGEWGVYCAGLGMQKQGWRALVGAAGHPVRLP